MRTIDLIRFALGAIVSHRMRSALTVLGIAVGIGAVVLLTSIGEGVRQFVFAEFNQFGTHIVAIIPGKANTFGMAGATVNTTRPLTLDDAAALARVPDAIAVVPTIQGNASVEFGKRQRRVVLFGVSHDMPAVWNMAVRSGRFLPREDFRGARAFAVLGSRLRDELFGDQNALGARIRIGGETYRVLGVMESKGQMLGFDLDDTVFIPAVKALAMFDLEGLMEIDLVYRATTDANSFRDRVKAAMIARHGHEDFTINTQDEMLDVLDTVLNVLTLGVGALGGISLLVGAVGILTIMTIAVTERTAEIGLLRAIGARRAHVLGAFLVEASVLGFAGGLLGSTLAVALVEFIGVVLPQMPVRTAWEYVGGALALALAIGVATGIVPALRAAQLQPLEALRAE
ncbi:MAG: ABC transporter permease [Gammaproteobacteria bacterium]|nr:ABC transporter permease [Gammaproteobacteria bacterium]